MSRESLRGPIVKFRKHQEGCEEGAVEDLRGIISGVHEGVTEKA